MEKVIFLDIDGVLNSNFWNNNHQEEISDGTLIDEEKVKLLGELIRNTDAKIVLHSGWKNWFDTNKKPMRKEAEKLRILLEKEGLVIEDVTPDYSTEDIRRSKKFSLIKAGEILAWLEEHKEVKKWIVIDDLDLHNAEVERHQVRTDQRIGLTMADIVRAEKMLLF
ncbi:MAG: HAD domain-containing protein [Roseburia sp.]